MKKIFIAILLLASISAIAQSPRHQIVADTVQFKSNSANKTTLQILNKTKDTLGFLFNTGNGVTIFKRALKKINDTVYLVGNDTLKLPHSTGADTNYIQSLLKVIKNGAGGDTLLANSGDTLVVKSLIAGTGVSFTVTGNAITINSTGGGGSVSAPAGQVIYGTGPSSTSSDTLKRNGPVFEVKAGLKVYSPGTPAGDTTQNRFLWSTDLTNAAWNIGSSTSVASSTVSLLATTDNYIGQTFTGLTPGDSLSVRFMASLPASGAVTDANVFFYNLSGFSNYATVNYFSGLSTTPSLVKVTVVIPPGCTDMIVRLIGNTSTTGDIIITQPGLMDHSYYNYIATTTTAASPTATAGTDTINTLVAKPDGKVAIGMQQPTYTLQVKDSVGIGSGSHAGTITLLKDSTDTQRASIGSGRYDDGQSVEGRLYFATGTNPVIELDGGDGNDIDIHTESSVRLIGGEDVDGNGLGLKTVYDSLLLYTIYGNLKIDTLRHGAGTKALRWDRTTKRLVLADTTTDNNTNIYNSNGVLTGNRTVDLNFNNLSVISGSFSNLLLTFAGLSYLQSGGGQTGFYAGNDSTNIKLYNGNLKISNLVSQTNATDSMMVYDPSTRAVGMRSIPNIMDAYRQKPIYSWDYMAAGVATANFSTTAIGAGTAAYTNTAAGHPGYMTTTSSATANSGHYSYYLNLNTLMYFQGGEVYEAIYQPKVASNTNTTTRIGFHDATTVTDAVDGAYFEIPPGSFAVVAKTANNSTRTTSSTIGTLTVDNWYKFRITVNSNATSILFEIYDNAGALVGSQTNTANIPTTSARLFGAGYISTNSGTSATLLGWLDYQAVQLNFPNR